LTRSVHAHLFDVYPVRGGMAVWLLADDGTRLRLVHPWAPRFYYAGRRDALRQASALLRALRAPVMARPATRHDLLRGDVPVTEVTVTDPLAFPRVVARLGRLDDLVFYNCDIGLPQMYLYEHRLFPLGRCAVDATPDGMIRKIAPLDSPWDPEYTVPPLTVLRLRLEGDPANPNHGHRAILHVAVDGEESGLTGETPADLLASLSRWLHRYDPDILLTEWGDSFLFPRLRRLAALTRLPLPLSRDPQAGTRTRRPRSYMTYGQIVYTAGGSYLHGRWHLDTTNSFTYEEAELPGLFELSRLGRLPVQHAARTSVGTVITSMQLDQAYQDGILIPWRKSRPEAFKSAGDLLLTDRGGLTYMPLVGAYGHVGELDFAAMYPAIMTRFNISQETVNCPCCRDDPAARVPGIPHHLCRRRRGLIPRVLARVLERRAYFKERRAATTGDERHVYNMRQTALKWVGVVSFGYQGYKNARFGQIEAHECTTALSREMLLRAKEVAEAEGYRMLHALVDSVWLEKPGATRADYEALARMIVEATELPIAVEGVYRWIAFVPSRTHPLVGVPNRFFGVFEDGASKVRGIELRRGDTPPLVAAMQSRMLALLFQTATLEEARAQIPAVMDLLHDELVRLRQHEVRPEELVIRTVLSQDPREYEKGVPQAVAAHQLLQAGATLHPGEAIEYIITNAASRIPGERAVAYACLPGDWSYDEERYARMLRRATETLLTPFRRTAGADRISLRPGEAAGPDPT
jgi:DNA polymerase elongation subunit (family B)